MQQAYIVDAVRTPVGKYGGALSSIRPDDLASLVISSIVQRNPELDYHITEEVIFGAANQAGEDNRNVARMALLMAGLPLNVPGVTVNRLCASGLHAISEAAKGIQLGYGDIYLAGGVESMSRAPYVLSKSETPFSRKAEMFDTSIGWRFTNPKLSSLHYPFAMGQTAENVAEKYKISREEQDQFARKSQEKYQRASDNDKFVEEIIPVNVPQRKQDDLIVREDEHPRLSSLEQLAKLKPAFKDGGTVTAGNSSGVNDGASCLLIVSEKILKDFRLKPMARILSSASAGVDPAIMGVGPVPATRKALKRAGIARSQLDLIELNEAFAAQSIACIKDLELDDEVINVNGGSIAIGHPLGCSGARISTTLVHELNKRDTAKYALATMCVGVGQGMALVIEKV
ncbi:MAG: acetyl-CoA C-acyltransferase [Bacteroidetes bacterium MED-G17]|nr:MAG: acetyl-CoA C-acyltransferase [Bacteroidetes bacterium MED-G17]CAI8262796.1 MAG: Beta-ketoadipyl-CoA thiolase [Bacteroidetes bacterium MED-G17]|tara:strand:- start:13280 stop:14479 length:1200 start_codon:yes stop_codon:yes gene_type:complete